MNRRKERKEDHIVWAIRWSHLLLLLQYTFFTCHLLHMPFFLYTSCTNRQKCQQPFELQLPLFRLKQPNAFCYNRRTEYLKQSLRVPLPLPPDWTYDASPMIVSKISPFIGFDHPTITSTNQILTIQYLVGKCVHSLICLLSFSLLFDKSCNCSIFGLSLTIFYSFNISIKRTLVFIVFIKDVICCLFCSCKYNLNLSFYIPRKQ